MIIVLLISILPTIIIANLIYKSDIKEKEPKKELVKSFLLGIVSVIITLAISFIFNIIDISFTEINYFNLMFYTFICVALVEEFSKWIVGFLFLKNNKNFDYTFDGIVYFTFIALGFATVDNILYTISGGLLIAIIRAIATVPGHAFFGIFSGYYYSLYRKEKEKNNKTLANKYLLYSLLIPIAYHGFFDFCLFTQNISFLIIFLVFLVALYDKAIKLVKQAMKEEQPIKGEDKVLCTGCGNLVSGNFCIYCGTGIEKKKYCTKCGREAKGKFCIYCGNKIEE